MNQDTLNRLMAMDKLREGGHEARRADNNLGLGWVYYGLARAYRPKHVVVVGSWRGFVPAVIGNAMMDNVEGGRVTFIDPSMVDDFWTDPERVHLHFRTLGAPNVQHYKMTTQEFVRSRHHDEIGEVGMLFVDGMHTAEQAQYDHEAFADALTGPALFHDSKPAVSTVYDKPYDRTVWKYLRNLRDRGYSVLDVPLGPGLAMVLPPAPLQAVED